MRLEKLARFDEELETIVLFIAEDSQSRALKFYDELIAKIEQIPISPLIYRQREKSKDENVRELIFKGYTVPFLIDNEENKIIILGIFSQNIWKDISK
jgi:plasmid stabilization system protein ParE